jgi:SAM-dependent methyltransferase
LAIGTIHGDWLSRLANRRQLPDGASWVDLGPQDIQLPRSSLLSLASRHRTQAEAARLVDGMFVDDRVRRDGQLAFYGLFGARSYTSIDLDDPIAVHKLDLNSPVPDAIGQFDVVTNFGTAEHVFNIGQLFETIHDLLKPGGVSLHVCPSFAFVNHGFYNLNPNLYIEMARQNGYELIDFSYIDNMFVRDQLQPGKAAPFDFDALPIALADMESTQHFMTKVVARFTENLHSSDTREILYRLSPDKAGTGQHRFPGPDFHICFVFDLAFVALRKLRPGRGDFVMPIQDMSGVKPLDPTRP